MFMKRFMNFVPLVYRVLKDVMAYFFFLVMWVAIFALFYQTLAVGYGRQVGVFAYL